MKKFAVSLIAILVIFVACQPTKYELRQGVSLNAFKYIYIETLKEDPYDTYSLLSLLFKQQGFVVISKKQLKSLPINVTTEVLVCSYRFVDTELGTGAMIQLKEQISESEIYTSAEVYKYTRDKETEVHGAIIRAFSGIVKEYGGYSKEESQKYPGIKIVNFIRPRGKSTRSGCFSSQGYSLSNVEITNFTPAYLEIGPRITYYEDPMFNAKPYRTFSVFPNSILSENSSIAGILEKQMLYALRNSFEELGYRFVDIDSQPDFVATLDASAPYREINVPPQSVTLPHWVPSQTIRTNIDSYGTFNWRTFGDYGSTWGSWRETSTATTQIPGYLTTKTYISPGYTTGVYSPSVTLYILNPKTLENVWAGIGVSTVLNHDVRISGQFVLQSVAHKFPQCKEHNYFVNRRETGQLGIYVGILTVDGNNYYPAVLGIEPNSPASKAGIRLEDIIIAVDGESMRNKTWLEAVMSFDGEVGEDVHLTVWRVGRKIDFCMTRRPSRLME